MKPLNINTIRDMICSPEFQIFYEQKMGNDLFINDPERAKRIHEYAENSSEGSTHAEIIEDWREFLNTLYVKADPIDCDGTEEYEITQEQYDSISKEIDDCEAWHEKNGSLHDIIG